MSEPGPSDYGDQFDSVANHDAKVPAIAKSSDEARESHPEAAKPRKRSRKREDQVARPKRLKGLYNDDYRLLLNSTITDATSGTLLDLTHAEDSVIGVSKWTAMEKRAFFRGLDKYGRDNVPSISALIQTKSPPEVRDYLLLLQHSLAKSHRHDSHTRQPALYEFPAAAELSEECCRNLDTAAEALAWYQDTYEAKKEREKHGDYWLLTSELGQVIERCVQAAEAGKKDQNGASGSEDDEEEEGASNSQDQEADAQDSNHGEDDLDEDAERVLDTVPAARLLNLKRWIRLIELFSANARSEESWKLDAGPQEKLGIYHTAFEDFHRLAVSVTQRLVAAVIFQAMTRLRMTDRPKDNKAVKPRVRRNDVLAAVDILGLPRSSWDCWIKAPRRCGLQVRPQQKRGEKLQNRILSYDEVECELSQPSSKKRPRRGESRITGVNFVNGHSQMQPNAEHASQDLPEISDSSLDDIDDTNSEPDEDDPDTQHVEYAEIIDQQQSRLEEMEMWKILGQTPPAELLSRSQELPKKPRTDRKTEEELLNWRDVLDFKSPWERYGDPVEEGEFVAVHQRMKARRERRRARRERLAAQHGGGGTAQEDSGRSNEHEQEESTARDDESADEGDDDGLSTEEDGDAEMEEAEAVGDEDDKANEKGIDKNAGEEVEEAEAAEEEDGKANRNGIDEDEEEEVEEAKAAGEEDDKANGSGLDEDAEEEEEQDSAEDEAVNEDVATRQSPTRRQLQPRRAREAATNSISATPILQDEDELSDSGDDFRPQSPE